MTFALNVIPVSDRVCGECQECCRVLAVVEVWKPKHRQCEHQCPTGCAIQDKKPETCKEYRCHWLQGKFGREDERPDKLGLIFDDQAYMIVSAWETREGALNEDRVRYLLTRMAKTAALAVRVYNSEKIFIMGPEKDLLSLKAVQVVDI